MKKTKEELNIDDLNNVSGGKADLNKYLKELAGKDRNKVLVDNDNQEGLVLNPSIPYANDGNLNIIEREKDSPVIDAELYIKNE